MKAVFLSGIDGKNGKERAKEQQKRVWQLQSELGEAFMVVRGDRALKQLILNEQRSLRLKRR